MAHQPTRAEIQYAQFKIVRTMLHNDPELAKRIREYFGWEEKK